MSNKKATNPFEFGTNSTSKSNAKKLDMTPMIQAKSQSRATEMISAVSKDPALHDLANKVIDEGEPSDLIELFRIVFDQDQIKSDAAILIGCDADQLERQLKSRQSDRSKSKRKGLRSELSVFVTYVASMYAELMVREQLERPYSGQTSTDDYDLDAIKEDQDLLGRKVRSLQSKASRLKELAKFKPEAKEELNAVKQEIARLNQFRTNVNSTVTVIKAVDINSIRDYVSGLSDEEQIAFLDQIKQLG